MRFHSIKIRPKATLSTVASCAFAVCTLTFSACGKDSDNDAASAKGFDDSTLKSALFLTPAELAVKNTKVLDSKDLEGEVNSLSDLYNKDPDTAEDEEDKALSDCIEKNIPFKIQVEGNKFAILGEAKPFECKTKDGGSAKYSTFRMAIVVQCEEFTEAAKALNGKTVTEVTDDNQTCAFGKESRSVSQSKIAFEFSGGTGEEAFKIAGTALSSSTSAEGGPCVQKDKVLDDCVKTDLDDSSATFGGTTTKSVNKTILTNQKSKGSVSLDQKYFDGGAIAITLADWTGSAKYTAQDAAPTWTLTRGSESKQGTLCLLNLS